MFSPRSSIGIVNGLSARPITLGASPLAHSSVESLSSEPFPRTRIMTKAVLPADKAQESIWIKIFQVDLGSISLDLIPEDLVRGADRCEDRSASKVYLNRR